jgi:peptide deformylase
VAVATKTAVKTVEKKKFAGKIHEVVKWPEPVLAKRGAEVTEFDTELATLVEEMFESMYAAQGIGLAAPQIAISKRVTVIDISFGKDEKQK